MTEEPTWGQGLAQHAPQFTVAGFDVDDIETVVAQLTRQGVTFEQYDQPPIVTDAQGIAHFAGDAKVADFKDPHGNLLSLHTRRNDRRDRTCSSEGNLLGIGQVIR